MKSSARCEADRPTMVKDEGNMEMYERRDEKRRVGEGGGGKRAEGGTPTSKRQKVSQ